MGCTESRIRRNKEVNDPNQQPVVHGSIYNIFRLLSTRETPRWRTEDSRQLDLDEHLKDVVDVSCV